MPIDVHVVKGGTWVPYRSGEAVPVVPTAVRPGALPIGTAAYPYPDNGVGCIFIDWVNGNDSNSGSILSPKKTLTAGRAAVPVDGYVIAREGVYEENAGATSKRFTLQNFPGEEVWFDGTDVETSWTSSGGRWWAPITVKFTHQAGHSQASPDNASRWTDAQNPVAHFTDMVFIDGARLWQVESSTPASGQFYVDYTANRVWIADNPAGKEVRVAKRTKMLHLSAACTIRGIGWRRYATEMWELGTVYVATAGAGSVIENCHMVDVATQPLCVIGSGTLVDRCTIIRPGQTGVHVNRSDNSVFRRIVIRDHNYEKFKTQPHAGGIKVTFSGNVNVEDCWIDGATNRAVSIWYDASNWGGKVVNNYTRGGYGCIFLEATGNMIVAGNRMTGTANTYHGLLLTISQDIEVWNNQANRTNGYHFANWQDNRQAVFPGERFWAEGLRWHAVRNSFVNNVFGGDHNLYGFYLRKDAAAASFFDYSTMIARFESNYFSSAPGQNPPSSVTRLAGLEPGSGVVNYSMIATFQAALPIAVNNRMTAIQDPTDADRLGFTGAVGLPAHIAAAMGVEVGTAVIGPPLPAPVPLEA